MSRFKQPRASHGGARSIPLPLREGPAIGPGLVAPLTPVATAPPAEPYRPGLAGNPATPVYQLRPYGRGNPNRALEAAADPRACQRHLLEAASAPNSRGPLEARKQLWRRIGVRAGFADPFDLTPALIYTVMGALKLAEYRSAELYLESAKAEHISLGRPWTDQLAQARRAALRSCRRYLGSPKQARGLPLTQLGAFTDREPLAVGGPLYPGRATLLASWWLLREIEASSALRRHVRLIPDMRQVVWSLPCTKTDQRALGAERTHSCSCEFTSRNICPYHAMEAHLADLPGGGDSPLFPAGQGEPTTKAGWADTFQALAEVLGLPLTHANGARAYTGHSARATGAIHLASTHVELWRIQLFGRWGSEVFLHYIQDAPLAQLDRLAVESSVQVSIQSARTELQTLLTQASSLGRLRDAVAIPTEAMAYDCEAATPPADERGPAPGPLVRNNDGGRVHRVGHRPLDSHPRTWRTRCGWQFAHHTSDYTFLDTTPRRGLCRRCLPRPQSSESSSSTSSSRASAGGSRKRTKVEGLQVGR